VALDAAKSKVAELETTLETIKEAMASEHRKEIQQTKKIHEEEMDRWLQAQEKYLWDKFSESTSLTQKAHVSEMQNIKTSQDQEVTKLKGELVELRTFNERGANEIRRIQLENDVLRKTIEERFETKQLLLKP
jgi:hypothetical protein